MNETENYEERAPHATREKKKKKKKNPRLKVTEKEEKRIYIQIRLQWCLFIKIHALTLRESYKLCVLTAVCLDQSLWKWYLVSSER